MTGTDRAPSLTQAAAGAATIGSGPPALIVGVQNVRRNGGSFFLGDVAFLSDGRFRALARRLPNTDDFNSAVGAWFIALAAARRNGRPEIDADLETGSKFLPDLRAVGLLLEDGFRPEPFRAWAPMSPQQAAAGKARAASAERNNAGRFTSALAALVPLDQPSTPIHSPLIQSTEEEGAGEETAEAEARLFAFLATHGAYVRPDSRLGVRLIGLMERRGADLVLAEAEDMAKVETIMSDRQWVLGLENGLEAIPSGRKTVDEAIAEESKVRDEARSNAIYDRMVARRLEYFRSSGGLWPEEWGERPKELA